MRKYGLVKLSKEDDIVIPCTWNLTAVDKYLDSITKTMGVKPVIDMITGVRIKPNPYEFDVIDSISVMLPRTLTYETIEFISAEDADRYLKKLKNNPKRLKAYTEYIYNKKEAAENRKIKVKKNH